MYQHILEANELKKMRCDNDLKKMPCYKMEEPGLGTPIKLAHGSHSPKRATLEPL